MWEDAMDSDWESAREADDFDTYNQNEADDYRNEGSEDEDATRDEAEIEAVMAFAGGVIRESFAV